MMMIPCLLCHSSGSFPDLGQLLSALTLLTSAPLLCPHPYCGQTILGLENITQHLASHVNHHQQHNMDSIDQVIKDLEDLVDKERKALSSFDNVVDRETDFKPDPELSLAESLSTTQVNSSCNIPSNSNNNMNITKPLLPWPPAPVSPYIQPPPAPAPPQYPEYLSPGPPAPPGGRSPAGATNNILKVTGAVSLPGHGSCGPYTRTKPGTSSQMVRGPTSTSGHVQCHLCGWMFDNENFLHLHRVLMHSRRGRARAAAGRPETELLEYTCQHCDHVSATCDQYTSHLQSAHGDMRHACKFCAKLFKLKGSLLVHQRVMHQSVTTTGTAGAGDDTTEDVAETGVTGVTTVSEDVSRDDIELTDTGNSQIVLDDTKLEEMTRISCKIDNKVALSDTGVGQSGAQQQTKHGQESKQWDCSFCGKKFTTKYFLKKHIRLHTGETPYSCNVCGKTFSFQQSYHKHMLYHTDEKPHCCNICGRAFKELSTLQNHERIHSGERPFVCETCGKSFRQRVSYLVHRRIHTGVLPYSCDTCGRKFRYKVTQRTHKCTEAAPAPGNTGHDDDDSRGQAEPEIQDKTSTTNVSISNPMPPLSQEIQQNLVKLRQAQGRRQFSSRIQNILSRTHNKQSNQEGRLPPPATQSAPSPPPTNNIHHQPLLSDLSELQRLCLEDLNPGADNNSLVHENQRSNEQFLPDLDQEQVTIHNGDISVKVSEEQLRDINSTIIDFNSTF